MLKLFFNSSFKYPSTLVNGAFLTQASSSLKCLTLQNLLKRSISSSSVDYNKGRTYESKPLPGSREDTHPDEWADRIFHLHEIKSKQSEDPYAQPSMINMICRVKKLKGLPHHERAVLEHFGIGDRSKKYNWVPVKNTPMVNDLLQRVKHLIAIQPLRFPDGIPASAEDLKYARVLPNGEFRLRKSIPGVVIEKSSPNGLTDELQKLVELDAKLDSNKITQKYLRKHHHNLWSRKNAFKDTFTSHYQYRLNQDGAEYRYSNLWRLDEALKQSVAARKNPDGTYVGDKVSTGKADWNTYPWSKY